MAKSKYMMHECAYCHKQTKMELVGGMQQAEGQDPSSQKLWYRCTRCKHSALIDTSAALQDKKNAAAKIDRNTCVEYAKEREFAVGQAIYHADLDDMGRVIRKDKTSSGRHSIIVSFEKGGEKKLLENVKAEPSEETFQPAPVPQA
ncbi:MAG TPA: hypothetical protein VMM57_07270 [Bacteroidota bacterium]|nr:hypothetical protein [Bacteroidota bacterium]